jgi:hypothetical protein
MATISFLITLSPRSQVYFYFMNLYYVNGNDVILKPVRLPLRAGTALFSDSYATIDSLLPVSVYHNFRKRVQKQAKIHQNFKDSIQK